MKDLTEFLEIISEIEKSCDKDEESYTYFLEQMNKKNLEIQHKISEKSLEKEKLASDLEELKKLQIQGLLWQLGYILIKDTKLKKDEKKALPQYRDTNSNCSK